MGALRLGLGLAVTFAIFTLASTAMAQPVVPPGNSAVNQYTETFPAAGGGAPASDKGKRSPAQALGAKNARRLEEMGPEGRAAAALAAATAPSVSASRGTAHGAGQAPGKFRTPSGRAAGGSHSGEPGGSSGLGEVIAQATGSSSSGQMGLLLPIIIIAGSATYAWRRRRRAT